MLGRADHGLRLGEEALALIEPQAPEDKGDILPVLAYLACKLGDTAQAEAYLRQAQTYLEGKPPNMGTLLSGLTTCELALAHHQPRQAADIATAMVAAMEHTRMGLFRSDFMLPWAQARRRLGRSDEADAVLRQAAALQEAQGSRRVRWLALAELATLAVARGAADEAQTLRQEARAVLDFITAHLTEPALRASFLGRPEVQALLTATSA